MDELQKIFDRWSEEQGTSPEVKQAGCKILEYLYKHCTDTAREEIASAVVEYGRLTEQNAFFAGYKQAFGLWMEILTNGQENT